jgi:hypothetical protein
VNIIASQPPPARGDDEDRRLGRLAELLGDNAEALTGPPNFARLDRNLAEMAMLLGGTLRTERKGR